MSDDVSEITHVLAGARCPHCRGEGRVRGGQVEYGEVVACPICDGKKYVVKAIALHEFVRLLQLPNWNPPSKKR